MNENSVVSLRQKDESDDPLTEILRTGARRLITRAVGATSRMHAGADWRDARGQEGVDRFPPGCGRAHRVGRNCSSI